MSYDITYMAGVFDACGHIAIVNPIRPRPYIIWRTKCKDILRYLATELEISHSHFGVPQSKTYHLEWLDYPKMIPFLTQMAEVSRVKSGQAKAALQMLQLIGQYDTDPKAVLISKKIAEALSRANTEVWDAIGTGGDD